MIYELVTANAAATVHEHWKDIPFLRTRPRIAFKPGLNVVYGGNGSGKSTLITTLAILSHCYQAGVQRVTETSLRDMFRYADRNPSGTPDDAHLKTMQRTIHDGAEVRYVTASRGIGGPTDRELDEDFGVESLMLMRAENRHSSGQFMYVKVQRVLAQKPTKEIKGLDMPANSLWQRRLDVVREHLTAQPRPGLPPQRVFLCDEPERSMDFERQAELWSLFKNAASPKSTSQIIVATHCPFALGIEGAHYIETVDGAIDKAIAMMAQQGWARAPTPAKAEPRQRRRHYDRVST